MVSPSSSTSKNQTDQVPKMIDSNDIADQTMEHCESTRYLTLALVGALALLAAVVGLSLIFLF